MTHTYEDAQQVEGFDSGSPEEQATDNSQVNLKKVQDENKFAVEQSSLPPDGGLTGWLSVAGSWLILFSSLGYIYSFGVYQDFYTRIFLSQQSPSSIAWMGSLQLSLPFLGALIVGKLFNAGHSRIVMSIGSCVFIFALFMLSLAKPMKYYQVLLSQGVGMGLGAACLFMPSTTIVSLRFRRRRSWATGVCLTGISFGAVCFPIMLNQLISRIGFADAVRVSAYIGLGCLIVGNALIRPVTRPGGGAPPDIKAFFKDPAYIALIAGTTLALLGVYFPVVYLQLYATTHGLDNQLAFYSLAIVNGSGIPGRLVGNYLADIYGLWNIQVPVTFATGALIWAVFAIKDNGSLIVVSTLYGITSGAWLSLTMAGVASLATTPQEVGPRVGIGMAIVSFGLLGSAPLQGALLGSSLKWLRPIAFSGSIVIASGFFNVFIRYAVARRKGSQLV